MPKQKLKSRTRPAVRMLDASGCIIEQAIHAKEDRTQVVSFATQRRRLSGSADKGINAKLSYCAQNFKPKL
jgi:hypothetical protein